MVITLKVDKRVNKNNLSSIYFLLTNGKYGTPSFIRKKIFLPNKINPKQSDYKNFRAKPKHQGQDVINEALKDHKERKRVCQTRFEAAFTP